MIMSNISSSKRLAANTIMLYLRMLVMMAISLYTSRIVLATLGVDDYGIYNVVGGIVVILSFLNVSMAGATQRFLNIELGKNDLEALRNVFNTSQTIHLMIAVFVLLVGETVGLWFLNEHMNIPTGRMNAANWVFQCSLVSFLLTIISVPYNACIIAHEKMSAFAYISVIEAVLKLLIIYVLVLLPYDKLMVYAILMAVIAGVIRLIYGTYCNRHFDECKAFCMRYDRDCLRSMLGFSGWTILGALGTISHTQGIAIIINMFFGVAVNSAQGIANQVTNIVNQFVSNFMTALNPQIVKSYAAKESDELCTLVKRGSRMGICLVSFFVIPLVLEIPMILNLWLEEVPEYAAVFIRLILLTSLCSSFASPLATARSATGIIKKYQIVLTTMAWMHLPFAWLCFKLGFPPQSAMYVYLAIIIIEQVYRIWDVCPSIGLSIPDYIRNVIIKCGFMVVIAFLPSYTLYKLLPETITFGIIVLLCSFVFTSISIFMFGITKNERESIICFIRSKLHF